MQSLSLKRSMESDAVLASKKSKKTCIDLENMPQSILDNISCLLEPTDLNALARMSKKWYVITDCMPLWKNCSFAAGLAKKTRTAFASALKSNCGLALLTWGRLCSESRFIFSAVNTQKALYELQGAEVRIGSKFLPAEQKDMEMRMQLLQCIQSVYTSKGRVLENNSILNCLENLYTAPGFLGMAGKLLYAELFTENRQMPVAGQHAVFMRAQKVFQDVGAPAWLRVRANFQMAFINLFCGLNNLSDAEMYLVFQEVAQNALITARMQATANFCMAEMRITNRTNLITNDQACLLFQRVIHSLAAKDDERLTASLALVKLNEQKCTALFNNQQAFRLLQSLNQNPAVKPSVQLDIDLQISERGVYDITMPIDDEEIVKLIQNIRHSALCQSNQRLKADLLLARMRLQERTAAITDRDAVVLLESIYNYPSASFSFRLAAATSLAKWHIAKEEELVPAEQLFTWLEELAQDHSVQVNCRIRIEFFKARLLLKPGSKYKDEKLGFTLLQSICGSPAATERNQQEAKYIIATAQCQSRVNFISDKEAFANLQNLDPAVFPAATFYMAELCLQNRIQIISREQAKGLLIQTIQNPKVFVCTRQKAKKLLDGVSG